MTAHTHTVLLPVASIDAWEHNPRSREKFSEAELGLLSASLVKEGQHHPVTVRAHPKAAGRYQLADGERRWRAAQLAGLATIEARVRELDDAAMFRVALSSGREGHTVALTPLEEARGYRDAINTLGCSLREVAEMFGSERSYQHVYNRLALLDLPEAAVTAVEAGELSLATATEVAKIPDDAARVSVTELVLQNKESLGVMPLKRVRAHIQASVYRPLSGAAFDVKEAALTKAGPCAACEFYMERGPGSGGRALCRKPSCFEEKQAAAQARRAEKEAAAGKKVLPADVNAKVYPKGDTGMYYASGYVEYNRAPPADLLKKEVISSGRAVPTWAELCDGAAAVTPWVAFDQAGRMVEVVKLEEALLAADENERAIFKPEILRRYNMERGTEALSKERAKRLRPGADTEQPAPSPAVADGWQDRASAWIAAALEAAPTLPPGVRERGFQLLREVGAATVPQVVEAPSPAVPDEPVTAEDKAAKKKAARAAAALEAHARVVAMREKGKNETEIFLETKVPRRTLRKWLAEIDAKKGA